MARNDTLSPRRHWVVVLALLGGAVLVTLGLVFPGLFGPEERARHMDLAGGLGPEPLPEQKPEDALSSEEPAAPEESADPDELVPYGDRSLAQEEAIRGKVRDEEGRPVADAIVVAAYKETRARPYELLFPAKVRSEEDGFFILGPLARRSYWVLAIKKGEDGGVGYAANATPGAWVDLVLAPGAKLTGTVTAREDGEPVAGAKVICKDWTFHAEAETDEEGKYALAPLPATQNTWMGQQVVVVADGFRIAERSNLLLKNDREYTLDFRLEEGDTLRGKVVDAQSLRPIANARVAEGWEPYHHVVSTAEDGTFELANVDTSPNLVFTVVADGYQPQERQSDGTGRIELRLDASLVVEGTVKDPQDEVVPNARVYLHRVKYTPGFKPVKTNRGQTYTEADGAGKFRFENVLPGQVAVVAFHREFAPGEKGPIEVVRGGAPPEPVTVTMKHGMTVSGEVRDLNDNPIPDIKVQLHRWWGGRIKGYKYALRYIWSEQPTWYTDAQGRFELRGAIAGKHWLAAYDRSFGWTGTQLEGVEGQRITDVIISFAGAMIEGVFLTASGDPVPNAWVYAKGPKNTPRKSTRYTQTDALGRFRMRGLKDGSYDLSGHSSYGQPEPRKDVPAGTTGVELKLKTNQVLAGEVVSVRTGRPLERFYLSIQPHRTRDARGRLRRGKGTRWQGWLKSPDGRFERPVLPGRYDLTFKAPNHAPRILRELVVEELVPPLPIFAMLDAGGGIRGLVLGTDGKPLRNQYVNARVYRAPGEPQQPTDWLLGGNDRSDSKGRYFIEGLAPGTYLIQLNLGRRGSAVAQVSVTGTEMVDRNLQLVPTGHVVLRVKDEEGEAVQGVSFTFYDENRRWIGWARQSNKQGMSTSRPLRMGPAVVRAHDRNKKYEVDEFTVTVQSGKTITVDVTAKKKPEDGEEK